MKFKFFNFILVLMFLTSCGTLKSGFVNSKKDNSDEFLVEKKMPLKMPPSFNELPKPGKNIQVNKENTNEIKSLITKKENNENIQIENKEINENLKDKLLEKIKEN